MSMDFRGDPSSALLEVLDPEQNDSVRRSLPGSRLRSFEGDVRPDGELACTPFRSRCWIVWKSSRSRGYTEVEKFNIVRKYLITKQMEAHGLKEGDIEIDR